MELHRSATVKNFARSTASSRSRCQLARTKSSSENRSSSLCLPGRKSPPAAAMSPQGKISCSTPSSGRKMGLYERSVLQKAAKEEKLKQTEAEMMGQCTFTPKTNKSPVAKSVASSPSNSSSVFDRLYADAKKITPRKSTSRGRGNSLGPKKTSPTSVSSSKSTPSRFEMLYEDAVRRNRNRKLTDKEEEDERKRRLETKELKKCTFSPTMKWGSKERRSPSESKSNKSEGTKKSPPMYSVSDEKVVPPVKIVTMPDRRSRSRRRRRKGKSRTKSQVVSPLREPPAAATEKKAGSGTDHTDYGSI